MTLLLWGPIAFLENLRVGHLARGGAKLAGSELSGTGHDRDSVVKFSVLPLPGIPF